MGIGRVLTGLILEGWPVFIIPTGRDERGVLGVGSIPVAILPSCECMHDNVIYAHEHEWVVKHKEHLRGSIEGATIHHLAIIRTAAVLQPSNCQTVHLAVRFHKECHTPSFPFWTNETQGWCQTRDVLAFEVSFDTAI